MDKQTLYLKLPLFLKSWAISILAFKNKKLRKGKSYRNYLNSFIKTSNYSEAELKNYQQEELSKLLLEIFEYSEYYKKLALSLNLSKKDVEENPQIVLQKLPFLNKATLKNELNNVVNKNPKRKIDSVNYTSGTTGTPTITYYDKDSIQKSFALLQRFYIKCGIGKKPKSIRFSGRIIINANRNNPPFWVYNKVDRQLFVSTYHLNNQNLKSIIDKINSFKPNYLDGYPSAIYVVAKYINNHQKAVTTSIKFITTTAETLYEYQRDEIEKAFSCKVYNQYSSSEGGVFITECKKGHYHLNLESGIFEFYNSNGKAVSNGFAELVSTSFRNFKTPLIKYKTGDWVELDQNIQCNCGYNTPIVKKIIGREDDILFTQEKGYVGRMDTAYKGLTGILKSQLIQNNPSELKVKQIVDENYNEEIEKLFIKNLRDRLGNSIEIRIELVNDIPLGANGKFKAVIRNFKLPAI
jgi:phenylacetate-CoA ligase